MDMQVGIVLGSRSQWNTMKHTAELLAHLGITYEARIITANKNSNQLHEYASKAINRGLEIIIAGSTGKTYLPGIIASKTEVPVLGIQINNSNGQKKDYDSDSDSNKINTIRMLDTGAEGATNAALFAAGMLANKHPRIRENLMNYRNQNEHKKDSREKPRNNS
ncbi:MAG: AIR carboxylase family protein [Gammaproteobacteria bacterium]|nr:AIR carboxylase family protein [Gammaproteobacteria bacterium]